MTISVQDRRVCVPDGAMLPDVIAALSPFGTEPVIAVLNGARVEPDAPVLLAEGDALWLYPLLIGG